MAAIRWMGICRDLLVPIDSVRQHPANPNNGDPPKIAESIQINGYFDPVTVQQSTGYLISGNHRYEALLLLGAAQIPVNYVDWDDETALRCLIVSNHLVRIGRDDPSLLLPALRDLQTETEKGLLGTGHDEESLIRLVRSHEPRFTPTPESTIRRCGNCGFPL